MNDNMRKEDEEPLPGYSFEGEYDEDDPALDNACQTLTGGGWPYYTRVVAEMDGSTGKSRIRLYYKSSSD